LSSEEIVVEVTLDAPSIGYDESTDSTTTVLNAPETSYDESTDSTTTVLNAPETSYVANAPVVKSDSIRFGDVVSYTAGIEDIVVLNDSVGYSMNEISDMLILGDIVNYITGVSDNIALGDRVAHTMGIADTIMLGDIVGYVIGVADTIRLGDTVSYGVGIVIDTISLGDSVNYSIIGVNPKLSIVNVSPDPVVAYYGTPFDITVTVAEVNGYPCTGLIIVRDNNNNIVAQSEASFNALEQKEITFRIDRNIPVGTYTWTVEAYNSTTQTTDDTRNITVNITTPEQIPYFTIKNIIPSTVNTTPSSRFSIAFIVGIYGATSGTCILYVYDHNNNKILEQFINFPNTEDQTIIVSFTAPSSPGSYLWKAQAYSFNANKVTDEKTFTINVSGTGGGTTTTIAGIPWWIILIVAILILLLLGE